MGGVYYICQTFTMYKYEAGKCDIFCYLSFPWRSSILIFKYCFFFYILSFCIIPHQPKENFKFWMINLTKYQSFTSFPAQSAFLFNGFTFKYFFTPFTSSIFFLCWSNSVTKLLNYSNCSISVKFEMLQYFSWIFELKLNKEQRNQVCQTNQNISKVVRKQLYSCINIVLNKLDWQYKQQITIYLYSSQGIVYLISQWFPL